MKKTEEYSSLRNEILGLINIQNSYIIAMYTITVTIFVFGIERKNEWIFLLPYIIFFSFQRIISAKNDAMVRIAAYISVYLEEGAGWESRYGKIVERTTIKNNHGKKFSKVKNILLGRISSMQLGLVCSVCSIIICICNNLDIWNQKQSFSVYLTTTIPIFTSVVLFSLLRMNCNNALTNMSKREIYIEQLKLLKSEE